MTDLSHTLTLAKMAGLDIDTTDHEAIYLFASLYSDHKLAQHVVQSRVDENAARRTMQDRIAHLESRQKSMDKVLGGLTSYVDYVEKHPGFFNDYLTEHVKEQKRKRAKYMLKVLDAQNSSTVKDPEQ